MAKVESADQDTETLQSPPPKRRARNVDITAIGVPLTLIGLIVVFGIWEPNFLGSSNWVNILRQGSVVALVAFGLGVVMISGGLDLSVGSTLSLASVATAMVAQNLGIVEGVLAGIAVGAMVGIVNGLLIAGAGIPPFIATLGTLSAAGGLALIITDGLPVHGMPAGFDALGAGQVVGIPIPSFLVIAVLIALWFVLRYTRFGTHVYAIGANETASWLSGIRVPWLQFRLYVMCGMLTGLGSVVLSSRVNSGQPTLGQGMELEAIAVVLIGGVRLGGGEGSILRIGLAALLITVLKNGLNVVNISSFVQDVSIGGIIIFAALADAYRQRGLRFDQYLKSVFTRLFATKRGLVQTHRSKPVTLPGVHR